MLSPFRRILWAMSDRSVASGFPVGFAVDDPALPVAQARLAEALALLAATRPRWLRRMRSYVSRIQVRPIVACAALWHARTRQVEFDEEYLCRAALPIAIIASTLVHEFTHARLGAVGIRYSPANRFRIERLCIGQEIEFVRSLPIDDAREQLLDTLVRQSAQAHEIWSDAESDRRWKHAAHVVGLPPWLLAGIWRVREARNRWRKAA